jgi:uncharacterized protein (TIGR02145 family)
MMKILTKTIVLLVLIAGCKKEDNINKLPSAPVLLQPQNGLVAGLDSLVFQWQESHDPEGDDITYSLEVTPDSTNWQSLRLINSSIDNNTALRVSLSNFKQGKKYYWRVITTNHFKSGNLPKHEEGASYSKINYFYTTPPNVKTITSNYNDATINLSWDDAENMDFVEVTFEPVVSSIVQPIKVAAGVKKLELKGLENYKKYTFVFKANNKLGHISKADTIKEMPLPTNYSVRDADFNIYSTITIGNQVWLIQNLKTSHYQDGSPIESNKFAREVKEGYGFLYYTPVILDPVKKITPKGYHVSTDEDWKELEQYIGMPAGDLSIMSSFNGIGFIQNMTERGALAKCGKALASATGWDAYGSKVGNGTDFYHLCVYPSGYTFGSSAVGFTGSIAHILTSTLLPGESGVTVIRVISNESDGIYRAYGFDGVFGTIRCVKD